VRGWFLGYSGGCSLCFASIFTLKSAVDVERRRIEGSAVTTLTGSLGISRIR